MTYIILYNNTPYPLLSMVVNAYSPSLLEAEAAGFQIWSQSRLHSETLSQKKRKKEKETNKQGRHGGTHV